MRRGCDAWRHRPIEHIRRLCRGRRPGRRTKRRGLVGCACRRRRPAPRRGWEVDRACRFRRWGRWPSSRGTARGSRSTGSWNRKMRHLVRTSFTVCVRTYLGRPTLQVAHCIDFLFHHDDNLKTGLKKIGQTQQKSGGNEQEHRCN